jgi:anaerobic ribonucleoside-triphosphate reductase activating protein
MCNIRIAGMVNDSIVDGPGMRFALFVQGCPFNCEGCHNPQTHNFDGGKLVSADEIWQKIQSNPLLDGVTFSGGEPFMQAQQLLPLAQKIKQNNLTLFCYTGFLFENLLTDNAPKGARQLLQYIDVLVDGPFVNSQKDYRLKFKGSANQRVIDVQKSLAQNKVCLVESEEWN